MSESADQIVDDVIRLLRAQGRNPRDIKLEEAKQLTLKLLRRESRKVPAGIPVAH